MPKHAVLANLILFIVLCLFARPALAGTNQTEWLLEQQHVDAGKIKMYVSHDAVRIVVMEWGYQLVAKAPKWTVHCFRPGEKIEWIGELHQFSGSMLNNPFGYANEPSTSLKAFEKVDINGLKCTRYAASSMAPSVVFGADDIKVAPKATEFVCRFYNIEDPVEIPIQKRFNKGGGSPLPRKGEWFDMNLATDLRSGVVVELATKSWKKLPFKASDFQCPQGFKRLGTVNQVAYSGKQKETMKEAIGSFGFTSDETYKAKSPPAKVEHK